MFKKTKSKPPIIINLKRVENGFKAINQESIYPFSIKKITRTMPKVDLIQNIKMDSHNMPTASQAVVHIATHTTVPSSSQWFNIDEIHQIQRETFPEFFMKQRQGNGLSFTRKDAHLYKYYRDSIIGLWRENSKGHLSAAVCRKNLAGDVGSIVRIHGFLENWGLINFMGRQHKGPFMLSKPHLMECFVCQNTNQIFYVAPIQDCLFQVCQDCFLENKYPLVIPQNTFKRIHNHEQENFIKKRKMDGRQIVRMLNELSNKPKEKQTWNHISKEMPQYSKQELIRNFLSIPLKYNLNHSIFEDGQDTYIGKSPDVEQSIFEDFQNPIQSSVAIAYYLWKTKPQEYSHLSQHFQAAQEQAKALAQRQGEKIENIVKMLCNLSFSKLSLKVLFLDEYKKLIQSQRQSYYKYSRNRLAESLKINAFVEDQIEQFQEESEIDDF